MAEPTEKPKRLHKKEKRKQHVEAKKGGKNDNEEEKLAEIIGKI